MLTVDTITDDQIRELRRLPGLPSDRERDAYHQATLALGLYGTEFQRRRARARCAEILNERGKR